MSKVKSTLTEAQQAKRNMNPHAEARLAMALWSREYAFEQNGGSMDFWDSIGEQRQRLCVEVVNDILAANELVGRAPQKVGKR